MKLARKSKRERALYLSDPTVALWRETVRRAKVLAKRPSEATADDVLRDACRLLMRLQDHEAKRARVDLAPPTPESAHEEASAHFFRGPPLPPAY